MRTRWPPLAAVLSSSWSPSSSGSTALASLGSTPLRCTHQVTARYMAPVSR